MSDEKSKKVSRTQIEKFLANFDSKKDLLKKIPGTAPERFFSSRLSRLEKKEDSRDRHLKEVKKLDKQISTFESEMSEKYLQTRKRCDGFLNRKDMEDLFGK